MCLLDCDVCIDEYCETVGEHVPEVGLVLADRRTAEDHAGRWRLRWLASLLLLLVSLLSKGGDELSQLALAVRQVLCGNFLACGI